MATAGRTAGDGTGLRRLARALRYRNYRLFFMGQSISLVGTWIQQVALSWLVYRLTHSALLLGIFAFSAQIPVFLLAPIAGVMVDRWNRHRMLIATQTLALGGAVCVVGAALFAGQLPRLRAMIHPIYRRLGVIPEVAAGVQTATKLTVPPKRM